MSNAVFPQSFSFGAKAITGTRRVAIIAVEFPGLPLPPNAVTDYRDAFIDGIPRNGAVASVRNYYEEMSGKKYDFSLEGVSTVSLTSWFGYFTKTKLRQGGGAETDRWLAKKELAQDAIYEAAAQKKIDFGSVGTVIFVVTSPNSGLPMTLPGGSVPDSFFAWPVASGGQFIFGDPKPRPYKGPLPRRKQFTYTVMPAEWNTFAPAVRGTKTVLEVLAHEIGHTLGLGDLYTTPVRDVTSLDIMSDDSDLPALSLPHRVALGWTPPAQLKTYNFLNTPVVDEDVRLTAAELTATGPIAGEFSGIVIEVQDGRRYYFEYRSLQNVTPPNSGPLQISDQRLGDAKNNRNRCVIGYDVMAGSYTPPIKRGPIILLVKDDATPGRASTLPERTTPSSMQEPIPLSGSELSKWTRTSRTCGSNMNCQ